MTTADPKPPPPRLALSPIPSRECLARFTSGEPAVDDWARTKAWKLHDRSRVRVTVAFGEGSTAVCGFYCLSLSQEAAGKLLRQEDRDAWKSGAPLAYLDWVGVARPRQSQGIGSLLLVDALRKVATVHEMVPVYGVGLRSLNDRTTALYERFGFRKAPKEDGPHPLMILPIWTVIDLFRG